jgi:dihydrofolate reductase
MPKLRYSVAVSLDGFIAPPDGSADWLTPYLAGVDFAALLAGFGGIITGRASYDHAAALHGWDFPGWVTAVMTHRPIANPPPGTTAFTDPHAALAHVTAHTQTGDIWLFGGGITATTFLAAGLLDEIELAIMPVLLGHGLPLFAATPKPTSLTLLSASTSPNGAQTQLYAVTQAN